MVGLHRRSSEFISTRLLLRSLQQFVSITVPEIDKSGSDKLLRWLITIKISKFPLDFMKAWTNLTNAIVWLHRRSSEFTSTRLFLRSLQQFVSITIPKIEKSSLDKLLSLLSTIKTSKSQLDYTKNEGGDRSQRYRISGPQDLNLDLNSKFLAFFTEFNQIVNFQSDLKKKKWTKYCTYGRKNEHSVQFSQIIRGKMN